MDEKKNELSKKLIESEKKYRGLINNISDIIFEFNKKGKCLYVSHQLLGISGFNSDEIIGQNVYKFVHPDDLSKVAEKIKESFDLGGNYSLEFRLRHKEGHYVSLSSRFNAINVEGSQKITGVLRDITKRKITEQKLIESEEKYRNLVNNLTDIILEVDLNAIVTYVSPQCYEIIGYQPSELLGKKAFNVIHSEDVLKIAEAMKNVLKSKKMISIDYRLVHKNGNNIYASARGKYSENGRFIVIIQDVSEKYKAKLNLKESEKKYKLITENANDLITILNEDFQHEYINEQVYLNILGFSNEDLIGHSPSEILHPDDVKLAVKAFGKGLKYGEGTEEIRVKHKNGQYIWLESKGKSFLNENGEKKAIIVSRNITGRKKAEETLEKQMREMETFINNIPHMAWLKDIDSNFIIANQKFGDVVGIDPEYLKHHTWAVCFGEVTAKKFKDDDKVVIEGKKQITFKESIMDKDGAEIYLETTKSPIFNEARDVIGTAGIAIDITERMKIEKELIESEEKFRLFAEQTNLGLILIQDNAIKYVNEAMSKISEYSIEEMTKWTSIEYAKTTHPDDLSVIMDRLKKRQKGDIALPSSFICRIITKSGKIKWIESFGKKILFQGKFADLVSVIDITEKIEAERKLKESEEKYFKIFHTVPNIMAITRLEDGTYIEVNQRFLDALGYRREEVIGKKPTELNIPVDPSYRDIMIEKIKKKGEFRNLDVPFRLKNGEIHIGLLSGEIFDLQGERSLITVMVDITELKNAEQKLKESEEKYREAYNLANFYKDLFAHDMNNILQSIVSTAEYHSFFRDDPEKLKNFGDITELVKMHVERGTSLISKVRTLSKLEETKIHLAPIGVFDVLNRSVENTKNSFPDKNINIKIEGLSKDTKIIGDDLLIDVFENILNNAIKFSDDDKECKVDIMVSKIQADDFQYVKLEFKDNGIGIPDDRKDSLFKELFERDKFKRGMGIGLTLVKKILDKYSGKIGVENRISGNYKEGSNFFVLFKEVI